jgi:1-acyl-sn-glycerol-3-phosphate acyltransferase
MIYYLVRGYTKLMLNFYTKKISVEGIENLPKQGPVLLASNHPNSFLDAVILNSVIWRPLWSLARGDAFKNRFAHKFLRSLYMMPVYRGSEGREYLQKNDATFDACYELFKDGGQVLIFSEGICTNQTALLPLKKGTARLAQQVWQTEQPLTIVPVGLTYDSYSAFGKNVRIVFGDPIHKTDFNNLEQDGFFTRSFNEKLAGRLGTLAHQPLVSTTWKDNPFLYIGIVLHFPVYALLSGYAKKKTQGTVFFDSIYFGYLVLALPIYWFLLYLLISHV